MYNYICTCFSYTNMQRQVSHEPTLTSLCGFKCFNIEPAQFRKDAGARWAMCTSSPFTLLTVGYSRHVNQTPNPKTLSRIATPPTHVCLEPSSSQARARIVVGANRGIRHHRQTERAPGSPHKNRTAEAYKRTG